MRALIQRVRSASVRTGGQTVAEVERGLLVLVGVTHGDEASDAERMANRLWNLRIFEDESGLTNLSASDLGAELLVVSQFTLYADASRGRRPSFTDAAPPKAAGPVVDALVDGLRGLGATVGTGVFGAKMEVELVNDGPFTLLLETGEGPPPR